MVLARVQVAYEGQHRAYREVVAAGVQLLRPHVAAVTCAPADLEAKIALFDPQLVVCGSPAPAGAGEVPAWVELPAEPWRPAWLRVGDRRREAGRASLEWLLEAVDEVEGFVRTRAARDARHPQVGERAGCLRGGAERGPGTPARQPTELVHPTLWWTHPPKSARSLLRGSCPTSRYTRRS